MRRAQRFRWREVKYQGELEAATRTHARREETIAAQVESFRKGQDDLISDRERIRGMLGETERERDTAIEERDKALEQLWALHDPTRIEGLRVKIDEMVKRGLDLYKELDTGPEPTETDEEGRGVSFPFFPPDEKWEPVVGFDREARELLKEFDPGLLFAYADGVNEAKRKWRRRDRQRDKAHEKLPGGEQMQRMIERLHRRPAEELECCVAALVAVKKEL
jgi:hypothetical protein